MEAVLAFSTASTGLVAVQAGGRLVMRFNENRRGQVEYLIPLIDSALDEAGISYKDLSRIGIVVGPGSFTGLRVGLAAARGFGLALKIPVVGISAFELYAKASAQHGRVLVALDTQRDDCFSIGYDGEKIWLPPMVRDSATLQQIINQVQPTVLGDAFSQLNGQHELPAENAQLAAALLALTLSGDPAEQPPEPYYLRAPDIGGIKAGTPA